MPGREQAGFYSFASAPVESARNGYLEFLIKSADDQEPERGLDVGAQVLLEGPFEQYVLPVGGRDIDVLLIAGGTGIAPMRSLAIEALSTLQPMKISIVHVARTPDDLAYEEELNALAECGAIAFLTSVTGTPHDGWRGRRGRIDQRTLRPLLSAATHCFACGPRGFNSSIRDVLDAAGRSDLPINAKPAAVAAAQ
jgi:CDP-4-dehydro-6-deoxyglucose reductase/3-phenylpropionate/trans-cinnamate dioxygenase ferredoxin reductase subunit